MKYKTLFRLLLKFMGVWVFVEGLAAMLGHVPYVLMTLADPALMGSRSASWYFYVQIAVPFVQLGIGAYLFFGGKWIADKAIPSNRPYCHECGYDLSGAVGDICNECGTAFRSARNEPAQFHGQQS